MLIVLPPSETKAAAPLDGPPLDLAALAFDELAPTRARLLDALAATCRLDDACERLTLKPTRRADAVANLAVRELATRPAWEVYAGDLYEALDPASLPAAARRRAATRMVIASSLWGLVRATDPIPPYRLPVCAHLVGEDDLEPTWRPLVGPALAAAAGRRGLVVDLRSSSYLALGTAPGLADRTLVVRVLAEPGGRAAGGVPGKRARGLLARHLLTAGLDPRNPAELAEALDAWHAVVRPGRPGHPATLEVTTPG